VIFFHLKVKSNPSGTGISSELHHRSGQQEREKKSQKIILPLFRVKEHCSEKLNMSIKPFWLPSRRPPMNTPS
jgi:hypothetical protein